MSTLNLQNFKPTIISLSYRLGEIPLFVKRFPGWRNTEHFSLVGTYSQFPAIPTELEEGSEPLVYSGYPISFVVPPLLYKNDWIFYSPKVFYNYYIDLTRFENFDAYLNQFSAKSRSSLRRKIRKFAEKNKGKLDCQEYKTSQELEVFFSLASLVSSKTYQERLFNCGLPKSKKFLSEVHGLAKTNEVRGYILFLHERPVAYLFSYCKNRIISYDYVGYDPAFQSLSPGTVLQFLVLQKVFLSKEFIIFDFTEGEGPHKKFFSSDKTLCAKTYFFPKSLKNLCYVNVHVALNNCVNVIGKFLEKFGFKSRIKKVVRKVA